MLNRRQFLQSSAVVGAGAVALSHRAWAFTQSPANLRKFIVSLPGLGPAAKNEIGQYIPLASKHILSFAGKATDVYNVAVGLFSEKMHPDLPGKTHFFGFHDRFTQDQKYLAGAIVARRGTPTLLTVTNLLPNKHILPVDPTILAGPHALTVGDLPQNRVATHLHGGLTPWFSDGTPFQWFTPSGEQGPSFMNVPGFPVRPGTGSYYYPNDQSARLAWYHDHAIGITRLSAYAGIASAYIIVDDFEIGLVGSGLLPDLVGVPLVIQDKGFVPSNILTQDPAWAWGAPGDLWYPHTYEANALRHGRVNPKGRWDWGPTVVPPAFGTRPLPRDGSVVPECFFDTILINGGVYPKVNVTPSRTRFRILNGSQARFYHLNLYAEDVHNSGEADIRRPGPALYQVGTEGGFLPRVATHNNQHPIPVDPSDPSGNSAIPDGPFNLLLAPGERADVVIDFNGVPAGTSFILYNDAPGPFPMGDSRNDYFTGDPDQRAIGGAPSTRPGFGANTRTILKLIVGAGASDLLDTPSWLSQLNTQLRDNFLTGNQPGLLFNRFGDPSTPGDLPYTGPVDRKLTLNEDFDEYGRLIQSMGTSMQNGVDNQGLPTWGMPYMMASTENPAAGSIEVWQIMNLTGDTHPIHFHLVNAQVIQRQPFTGVPGRQGNDWDYSGPATPPDPNELGWKETIRMNPGEITTVIIQFDLPNLPTAAMRSAASPRTGGREYVWHCHILEHEEHDMMRPLIVT
jgi:spore coat protein A, manganese oxidase